MISSKTLAVPSGPILYKKEKKDVSFASLQDTVLWNLTLITSGCLLCAWAINNILVPHQFLSGGLTGVGLIVHYLMPSVSLSGFIFLLNLPIFALGWFYVGRRFFFYSLAGMAIYSLAVMLVDIPCPVHDKIPAALLAGILYGAGCGLILKSVGSAGGTDILSIILLKRYSIRLGTTILFFNVAPLLASAYLFSLESVLYTLMFMYVSTRIVELVVNGMSQRKAVMIVSPNWKKISRKIISELNRGVTLIHAEGGYSGRKGRVLYTVVSLQELSRLKAIVQQTDKDPFVVVSDTLEVMGQRIGNQPRW